MAEEKEQAQAPFKPTFARLGRATWFTLESSFRADEERANGLEERLEQVGSQVQSTAAMGIPWMQLGDWSQKRTWTDDEWVAFLRMWKNYSGFVFDEKVMTQEEKDLMNAFTIYWTFYACAPERPDGTPDDVTTEMAGQAVDQQLEGSQERLGDPLAPCTFCQKCALGFKLFRCSRCKQAYYCTRQCQSKHWKRGHKRDCMPSSD